MLFQRLARRLLPILVGCALSPVVHAATADGFAHFITRDGDRLKDGDQEFRWVSVNVPDALQIISDYRFDRDQPAGRYRLPDAGELRDAVRSVRQLGGRVMRIFVITCRRGAAPEFAFDLSTATPAANESALQVFDQLLQICNEEGVRVIVPLVAYNSAVRGDWHTYGEDFWQVGSPANRQFKEVVRQVLARKNKLTGRAYLDDKAILGWQTGNELVIGDDPARRAWLHDFAAYVKSIDRQHLLIDGRNRPNDVYDKYDEFARDPHIDAVSYHTYRNLPQADTPAGTLKLIRAQLRGRLPLIVTEIAMYTSPDALRALLDEIAADGTVGGNWWALRFHNRDGGFYKHSDRGSVFEDMHWPGLPNPPANLPQLAREREIFGILETYAARIGGQPVPVAAGPAAPVLLPAPDPAHLAWRGSTGATGYAIQRADTAAGPWQTVAEHVAEHLVVYAPQYADTTAAPGHEYYYRLLAENSAGLSAGSNVVGPLHSDYRWAIDEMFDRAQWAPSSNNLALELGMGHDAYLEDLAVVRRADPARSATLAYRVPGNMRRFSVWVYAAQVPPAFFVSTGTGPRQPIVPHASVFDQGRRIRFDAELPQDLTADSLEIVIPAEASAKQAIGRVEIAWSGAPAR